MAKQTFTAGQILTAAQQNALQLNDYNWTTSAKTASYVLAAADAGTTITMNNAGATTITVNTSLFSAGDTVRIVNLGAGATTITAGTATVNSASSLALAQYQSGTLWFSSASAAVFSPDDKTVSAGGLIYLTGASFSSVASVSAPNNTFTSTYKNFRVVLQVTGVSTNLDVLFRFRASGTDDANNIYRQTSSNITSGAAGGNFTGNTTSFKFGTPTVSGSGGFVFSAFDINDMATSGYKSVGGFLAYNDGTSHWGGTFIGQLNTAKTFDSISFLTSTGTMTGNYRIYAYSES